MEKKIEVTKIFNAPIEMVWQVWVDPGLVKRWWGPKHFISPVAKIDFREGGRSIVSMKAPKEMGNQEFYSIWEYVTEYADMGITSNFAQIGLEQSLDKMAAIFH